MKKLILTAIVLMTNVQLFAQGPLPKGSKQFNAGVGLSGWGVPVYLGMDFGVHPDISVGGELSFRRHSNKIAGFRYHHNITGISGNANYHFNRLLEIPSKWDVYAGLNLGFYIWSSPDEYKGSESSGLGLGAQIGGRYYFNDKIGINLEFGGGNAFAGGKFGVSIKW